MEKDKSADAIEVLSSFLTDRRKKLIDRVLEERTRHVAVVLEDIYKPQNASAVLRTCECQGIQDVYVIENNHTYEINPDVVKGASKWLTLHQYPRSDENNTARCFDDLKSGGYKLVAADPGGDTALSEIDLSEPVAIVFGTEYEGLSAYAKSHADLLVTLPMYGFTESYNLSVSVAIAMQTIMPRLRASGERWQLSNIEVSELKLSWYKNHVRNAASILEREGWVEG